MNSSTDWAESSGSEARGEVDVSAEATAAFLGDTGTLALDTRRVLVQLLLGPSVDARRQSKLWPVLLRDEDIIRSRMHDLFLEVIIDREQQVAFTRQVTSDDIDVPILLRKASLTFLETTLILFLRQRLTQADAQGERAVVSLGEMREHMAVFERDGNPDHAKFERQVSNAVEKAKKLSLIQRIRGSDERFEVSPTLKLLFSAEEIQGLTRTYAQLVRAPGAAGGDDDRPPLDEDLDEGDFDGEGAL